MMKIAFLVKGLTFLRSMGTLIKFSENHGISCQVIAFLSREGKEYDNLKHDVLVHALSKNSSVIWVKNNADIENALHGCDAVVGQDMIWHHKDLIGRIPTFSISMFFDALHYAKSHVDAKAKIPTKTYFASDWFQNKANELLANPWPSSVLGNPSLDHSLFVDKSAYHKGSVLFLTPPQDSLMPDQIKQLNSLIDYCHKRGIFFILKDRTKTPWTASDRNKVISVDLESGFPYSSMSLLLNTDIHITAYGTSVIESNFLGKPAINLPVVESSTGKNHQVISYGVKEMFDNDLCITLRDADLIDVYETMVSIKRHPLRELSLSNNFSHDILEDIINTVNKL